MKLEVTVALSLLFAGLAAVVAYLAYQAKVKKGAKDDGKESGMVLSELGYIKGGIDDLKQENREQRKTNTEVLERLTTVEASTKQAHKRLDRIENK